MSRIGRKPCRRSQRGNGCAGRREYADRDRPARHADAELPPGDSDSAQDGTLLVQRDNDDGFHRSLHGLTRTLVNNMVVGVTTGYAKLLEINGVGYRVAKDGADIVLTVGFLAPSTY